MAVFISVLALLATFYELHLQRMHNEKSLKPLPQIELPDHSKKLAVHIRNHGLGPLIIDRLLFLREGKEYTTIEECLDLDPRSYMRMDIDEAVKRVVLPNTHLVVFETQFEAHEGDAAIHRVRTQLSLITLKMQGRDIYNNKITLERGFEWFSRYEGKQRETA